MDRIKEVRHEIENLEIAWKVYHKNDREHEMPDMLRLAKLRCELRELERLEK